MCFPKSILPFFTSSNKAMPRKSKILVSSLVELMPELLNFCSTKISPRQREQLIRSFSGEQKDIISQLVGVSLDNIPEKQIPKRALKHMYDKREQLNFIRMFSKCKKSKKKCLESKRDEKLLQSGRGVASLLTQILPLLKELLEEAKEAAAKEQQ